MWVTRVQRLPQKIHWRAWWFGTSSPPTPTHSHPPTQWFWCSLGYDNFKSGHFNLISFPVRIWWQTSAAWPFNYWDSKLFKTCLGPKCRTHRQTGEERRGKRVWTKNNLLTNWKKLRGSWRGRGGEGGQEGAVPCRGGAGQSESRADPVCVGVMNWCVCVSEQDDEEAAGGLTSHTPVSSCAIRQTHDRKTKREGVMAEMWGPT